jgi:hypothetical protein
LEFAYFSKFGPTDSQLSQLVRLLKKVHTPWGMDFGDSLLQATLIVAPGDLSRLTPCAYDLLKRCQGRVWEFKVQVGEQYDPLHRETYQELFELLLSLGLIEETNLAQKLKGSRKVNELKVLLESADLSCKGKKDDLVARVLSNFPEEELTGMVSDVILYQATDKGDKAVEVIGELLPRMQMAFHAAAIDTRDQSTGPRAPVSELLPGVHYDDGDVRITSEDVDSAEELWDLLMPDHAGVLSADLAESDNDE